MNPDPTGARIAIIEPTGSHGGMHYYDFSLADGMAAAGADVAVFTSSVTQAETPTGPWSLRFAYRRIFGQHPVLGRLARYVWGTLTALGAAVQERRTLVHYHLFQVGPLETFNVIMARVFGRTVVVTAHDVESFFDGGNARVVSRLVYGLARGVIVHNQVSRREVLDKLGVQPDRLEIIPHGNYLKVVPADLQPQAARERLGIPPDAKVLLFFGQIKEVKGLDLLLNAMPAILRQHPNAVLVVAGRPMRTEFQTFQAVIDALGISGQCRLFTRYIADEEVATFYAAADLVVLPYRRIYQSGVALMAMSYGRAVLTSDIPGMLELVTPQVTGMVFRSGDSADLATQAAAALSDDEGRCHIAARGKALMAERYDWMRIGAQTVEFYQRLLGGR